MAYSYIDHEANHDYKHSVKSEKFRETYKE